MALSRFVPQAVRSHRLFDLSRQVLSFAAHRMRDTQLQEVASSMTLATLLSLVPLLAVSLAVFAAFPSFESSRRALEEAVLTSFLPIEYSEVVVKYLHAFSQQATGLGAFGIGGLSVTALLLIDKFFVTVNRIFKVRTMRPWSQRAVIYWALLTLAPLAITLSLTLSGQMLKLAFGEDVGASLFPTWVLAVFQMLLQGLGYALLYKLVPNCHVPVSHALTGGMSVAVVGQIVKQGFEIYVTAGTLSTLYGAFVAFPVFLLWLYVNWILVFSGAAVTATIPLLTSGRYADSYRTGNDFLTGVALLRVLTAERAAGRSSLGVEELADRVDSYPEAVSRILSRLADAGYVGELATGRRRLTPAWALLADPETKTLREAFHALLVDPNNTLVRPESAQPKKGEGMLCEWYDIWTREHTLETPLSALIAGTNFENHPEGASDSGADSSADKSADIPPSGA